MMVPAVGESINEVTISSWLKKEGDIVELDEIIAEIDSDKATFDLTAESSGKLIIEAKEGDTIEIGSHICSIEKGNFVKTQKPEADESNEEKSSDQDIKTSQSQPESNEKSSVSPVAQKIIDDKGIDIKDVVGSGSGGKILKDDVIDFKKEEVMNSDDNIANPQRREKMTQLRKTIAKRLVSVKNETAMLTTFNEVDMSMIMQIRKDNKEEFEKMYGVKLGFMSFFVKACVNALQTFTAVNAEIQGEEIVYKNYYNIGVAVGTDKGLVVPVVRSADQMSFADIEKEIINLGGKARDGQLSIEELQGGTFTITNGGIYGSMLSTPILNPPQSGVLGMHNIVQRPIVINGKIEIRPMMYLALSYDHRIIDGKEAVSFLVRVKEILEDPRRLFLNL